MTDERFEEMTRGSVACPCDFCESIKPIIAHARECRKVTAGLLKALAHEGYTAEWDEAAEDDPGCESLMSHVAEIRRLLGDA